MLIIGFISNLDIFPLIWPYIISINKLTLILKLSVIVMSKTLWRYRHKQLGPFCTSCTSLIITSIAIRPIRLTTMLLIMSVSIIKTVITLYLFYIAKNILWFFETCCLANSNSQLYLFISSIIFSPIVEIRIFILQKCRCGLLVDVTIILANKDWRLYCRTCILLDTLPVAARSHIDPHIKRAIVVMIVW